MLGATIGRKMFDLGVRERSWFSLFQRYEREAPIGFYGISQLGEALLYNCFDYASISQRRRENYAYLLSRLHDIALFAGEIPDAVTPLGFPVLVGSRDVIRRALIEEEIFPPVHWDLTDVVPLEFTASHRLSQMIMTLPCDQRYNLSDMEHLSSSLITLLA
jgi:hypothetical protein